MKTVKTFKEAKKLSLKKWNNVSELIHELNELSGEPCGFCEYSRHLKEKRVMTLSNCSVCLVNNKCKDLVGGDMTSKIRSLFDTCDRIIDYIESLDEDD